MVKNQLRITLIFLFLSASLGIILRLIQSGIPVHHYKYTLHTHSHIALLGWVYNAAVILLRHFLISSHERKFDRLFWVTQITFVGMLFSFPIQGYAAVSITFSTLYLFCSYVLVYLVFKSTQGQKNHPAAQLLRWGGVYLVLSSIGPYALGYFMAKGLGDSIWYDLSIYWFLHFLYNGFFIFVIFAFLVRESGTTTRRVFYWMNLSMVPLFALSTLWVQPHFTLYALAFVAALCQVVACWFLFKGNALNFAQRGQGHVLLLLSFVAYMLKLFFQLIASFSAVQNFINATTPYAVIGFIHLVMLGCFTLFFLGIFVREKLLGDSRLMRFGLLMLVTGIVVSEALLFGQSLNSYYRIYPIPDFFTILSIVSSLMPAGIACIAVQSFRR